VGEYLFSQERNLFYEGFQVTKSMMAAALELAHCKVYVPFMKNWQST
jgi:hypothetical protein